MSLLQLLAAGMGSVMEAAADFAAAPPELVEKMGQMLQTCQVAKDNPDKVKVILATVEAHRILRKAFEEYKLSCDAPSSSTSNSTTPPPWMA